MYKIFIENPEQIKDIAAKIEKFRAKTTAKNIDSLGLNNAQVEAIMKNNIVYKNTRSL